MTKLNKRNISKVIKAIQDENKYFDMKAFVVDRETDYPDFTSYETIQLQIFKVAGEVNSGCGTASCIGGWANYIRMTERGEEIDDISLFSDIREVGDWLGISHDSAMELCQAESRDKNVFKYLHNITRAQAIATLEHLKKMGVVNWRVGLDTRA